MEVLLDQLGRLVGVKPPVGPDLEPDAEPAEGQQPRAAQSEHAAAGGRPRLAACGPPAPAAAAAAIGAAELAACRSSPSLEPFDPRPAEQHGAGQPAAQRCCESGALRVFRQRLRRRVTKTESAPDTAQAGAVISGRNWVGARCPRQRRRRPAGARRTERNRGPRARRGWRGRRARGRRPCSGPPGSAPRPDPGGARAPAALCGSRRAQRRDAVLASGRGDGPARSFSISEVLSGPPGRLAPSKMEKEGSTPRPPSPGRTSRSGGYHCPTAGCRIAAARLRCCVCAALRGLAVGATRLRLADVGGAGAGKCLRGSAQHAYVAGRALRRLLSGSKSSDLQRRSALRRRFAQT